ncbi:hypothetical protein PVV74_17220 [Roseovarius sp. SK2]|uniref:hypothetical protein n=1 Tax=Roseovarius TaxID=74030 RepID=UPI00237B603B|nr:hypothetical protein [Roseovarius sp. SK2]MDD9727204.1 hypothetical protein [Roseovarius sp. SK2]
MTKTALYRHYDSAGTLLYVGITSSPSRRIACHKNASDWFYRVANISLDWHDTLQDAKRAEREAIREEAPAMNIALQQNSPKERHSFPEGLIGRFGTVEAFAEAASAHELAPKKLNGSKRTLDRAAVYMWKHRGHVPFMWQPVVEALSQPEAAQ